MIYEQEKKITRPGWTIIYLTKLNQGSLAEERGDQGGKKELKREVVDER
jgi:hypothetical protein